LIQNAKRTCAHINSLTWTQPHPWALLTQQPQKKKKKPSLVKSSKGKEGTEACSPSGRDKIFLFLLFGFELSVYVCHFYNVLPVYWAYRVFSGSRNSCGARKLARHPGLKKKKKKGKKEKEKNTCF
jgi:hypothetical protein